VLVRTQFPEAFPSDGEGSDHYCFEVVVACVCGGGWLVSYVGVGVGGCGGVPVRVCVCACACVCMYVTTCLLR